MHRSCRWCSGRCSTGRMATLQGRTSSTTRRTTRTGAAAGGRLRLGIVLGMLCADEIKLTSKGGSLQQEVQLLQGAQRGSADLG